MIVTSVIKLLANCISDDKISSLNFQDILIL